MPWRLWRAVFFALLQQSSLFHSGALA
jgi:hypothetical protein